MRTKIIAIAAVAAVLGGCAGTSPEQLAALEKQAQDARVEIELRLLGPELRPTAQFDITEVEHIHESGDNRIMGEAFLRQQGGGTVTCAGAIVKLVPEGMYARERMELFYEIVEDGLATFVQEHPMSGLGVGPGPYFGKHLAAPPQAFLEATRTSVCDREGKFRFDGLADGRYFVVTSVRWTVGEVPQGGTLMTPVRLSGGKTYEAILSNVGVVKVKPWKGVSGQ